MRIISALFLLSFFSCRNASDHAVEKNKTDTASLAFQHSEFYTTQDTIVILSNTDDTLKYNKETFNDIIDKHPELISENIQEPDVLYHCNGEKDIFNSEAGQDEYMALYAYFLQQKNGIEKYAERRKKLIAVYYNINDLFSSFENGGTYFGHQRFRIPAYAEFSVYLFRINEHCGVEKTYNISKEKELYINTLRQIIKDESSIENSLSAQEKIQKVNKQNKIADSLSLLITDNFYLKRAQNFHYSKYEYY